MQTADTVKIKRSEMEKWLSAEEKDKKDWFTQKEAIACHVGGPNLPTLQPLKSIKPSGDFLPCRRCPASPWSISL